MKQLKFLWVSLLVVLMGTTVTSCLNTDDNNMAYGREFVRVNAYDIPVSFKTAYGIKLKPTQTVMQTDKKLAYIGYQYDRSQVTPNVTSVNITLIQEPYYFDEYYATASKVEGNSYVISMDPQSESNSYARPFAGFFFDQRTLILPVKIHYATITATGEEGMKQYEAEMRKHQFALSYDANQRPEGSTLTFYLHHSVHDTAGDKVERKSSDWFYQGFDVSNALSMFKDITEVKIIVKEGNQLSEVKEKSYTFKVKKKEETQGTQKTE